MNAELAALISLLILLTFLGMGMPVAFSMICTGLVLVFFIAGGSAHVALGIITWNALNNFILTVMPLFVFMGEIMLRSGISERMYEGLSGWFEHVPGRLAQTNIFSCAIFAATSGSSVATAATIGAVAYPEMMKRGYDRRMVLGSLAAGSTLGILIPPSSCMIVYAAIVGESISRLFIAGIIPGVALSMIFMSYIATRGALSFKLFPPSKERTSWKRQIKGLVHLIPVGLVVILVLGSMYLGVATPTEAAAGGAFGAMLVGFSYRRLNFKLLREATLTATNTSCMVLCLFYGGKILSYGLARLDAPGEIARTVGSLPVSAMIVFAGICFMYLVLGCVMEGLSMIIVTLPITYPIMMTLGFDSIWFGIVIVLLEEIAMITPPYGINLFVIHHISGGRSMADVIIGAAPYVVIMLGMIALLTIFPQLALWLPSMMK